MKTRRAEARWIDSRSRWQINVQREGMRKCFSDSTPGKTGKHLCEKKADAWLATQSTQQKFGVAYKLWTEDLRSPETKRTYKSMFENAVIPYIPAGRNLAVISLYDWQKVLTRYSDGRSANTGKLLRAAIMAFNGYCVCRNWDCIEIRKGQLTLSEELTPAKEKHALDLECIRGVLAAQPEYNLTYHYANAFKLALYTGLRRGELCGLQWQDIDTKKHTLTVRRSILSGGEVASGKTANARRTVPLTDEAAGVLTAQKNYLTRINRLEINWVFPSLHTGQTKSGMIGNAWEKFAGKIGAEAYSLHELRHTFISVAKADMPETLLKNAVGHSASMNTIAVYGHTTESDIERGREIISAAFGDICRKDE